MVRTSNFDPIARPYRWLEYLSFGPLLERCRFRCLERLADRRQALILGDGDGRFTARLMATNREIEAVAVDSSGAMLALLRRRVARLGDEATERLRTWQGDALEFDPRLLAKKPSYDLLCTHFFLDCLSGEEVRALIGRLQPHLAPNAIWLVSEFAIPESQPVGFAARLLIASLYFAFGLIAGLRARRLPDYATALRAAGFELGERKPYLRGILVSELWKRVRDE
jgi:SAM-dependent methyltransferase